jgi:UDP-2,3-diacylglucosamine pyrophosphatase LpxH
MLIKYISDLHLDYKSPQKKRDFLKLLNPNMFYIIAGDFYNDYRKTLSLIDELNAKKIHGY